ncbi:SWAHB protein, partial [Odontophorus gujanensis]|nr:SWAHB protein [Odontophorus gujanensis]
SRRGAAPSGRSMARELSQEAVLDFLWTAGGRAPNAALLRHFQGFLRDPALTDAQRRERRERFKRLVNAVATVQPAAAGTSKDIRPPSPAGSAPVGSLPPPGPRGLLPARTLLLSAGPRVPPLSGPPRARSPQPSLPEPSPAQSLPQLSAPGMLPLSQSRSLQTLAAGHGPSPSSRLLSSPDALPLAQSRSLQTLSTSLTPSKVRIPSGPVRPRPMLLHAAGPPSPPALPPPAGPGGLPPCSQPPPARLLLSRSVLPATDPQGPPASTPPSQIPVFRSIRSKLALLEASDDRGRPLRAVPQRSSSMHVSSQGSTVPLGRREHAWLVAVSAGRWAHVRGLFLEEPELALQRDFVSGFTVLHWLAKHGDGPGLQELAKAARQAGLVLDVDARSGCGYTPLHLAAIHGHTLVIKVLVLQLGCQVQVRDGSGRRPWEYLGSSTSGEIWQLLQAP